MAVTAPGSDVWVLSTPESARADAKSVTSSSKSVTHGRPHDSDDTLGASFSPALTLMQPSAGPGFQPPNARYPATGRGGAGGGIRGARAVPVPPLPDGSRSTRIIIIFVGKKINEEREETNNKKTKKSNKKTKTTK